MSIENQYPEDVKNYLVDNKEMHDTFMHFFNLLSCLSNKTYDDTISFISNNKNIFFANHVNGILFFRNIIFMSRSNFQNFEIYLDICINFASDLKNIEINESELIDNCLYFSNSIFYFYSKNFLSISSIVEKSYINDFIFAYFLPEIYQYDHEYADIKSKNILAKANQDNINDFLQFVKNNPKEHVQYRNLNYHPSQLHKLIRNDDIKNFQFYISHSNIDVNETIPFSYYERAKTNDRNISLIKTAVIYGSINIFKFLWKQNNIVIDNDFLDYAYCGKNYDIIHICEDECSFHHVAYELLYMHHKELIEYSFEKYKDEIIDDKENNKNDNDDTNMNDNCLKYAVRALNYKIIRANIMKILTIAKNEEHINVLPFQRDSYLDASLFI